MAGYFVQQKNPAIAEGNRATVWRSFGSARGDWAGRALGKLPWPDLTAIVYDKLAELTALRRSKSEANMADSFSSLNGRKIVVTGASSGIGAATARRLAAFGARVVGVDIKKCEGPFEQFVHADLGDPRSIADAVTAIGDDIYALCNIAGIPMTAPRERVLAVNWVGTRIFTEFLIGKIASGGVVINTASNGGRQWRENLDQVRLCLKLSKHADVEQFCRDNEIVPLLSYKLTKETLVVWTMLNAARWVERGLRCNVVSPGVIKTPMLDEGLGRSGERGKRFAEKTPRICSADEAADVYAFLCSKAGGVINGANIAVDAGLAAILNVEDFGLA